jgi:hypothetical protein
MQCKRSLQVSGRLDYEWTSRTYLTGRERIKQGTVNKICFVSVVGGMDCHISALSIAVEIAPFM